MQQNNLITQIHALDMSQYSVSQGGHILGTASLLETELARLDTSMTSVKATHYCGDPTEVIFEILTPDCHCYFLVTPFEQGHRWGVTRNGDLVETGKVFTQQREVSRILRLFLDSKH